MPFPFFFLPPYYHPPPAVVKHFAVRPRRGPRHTRPHGRSQPPGCGLPKALAGGGAVPAAVRRGDGLACIQAARQGARLPLPRTLPYQGAQRRDHHFGGAASVELLAQPARETAAAGGVARRERPHRDPGWRAVPADADRRQPVRQLPGGELRTSRSLSASTSFIFGISSSMAKIRLSSARV